MPKAIETFHHALGTVECGTDLPASHPIVKAAPHLFTSDSFDVVAEREPAPAKRKPKG